MSVRSIRFRGEVTSSGIVNFDGKDAKWLLKEAKRDFRNQLSHNNVKVAKHAYKEIGKDDKGNPIYDAVLKISKDCLRQAIFNNDQPNHNPGIVYANNIFIKFLASYAGLIRGYLFADNGIKRKSAVYISDAVQISKNISTIDIGTMNAPKESKEEGDDTSGLTMHFKETIGGLVTYEFEGAIDLSELQFISLSEIYDRKAIDPNYKDIYIEELEKVLGSKVDDKAFYIKNTAVNGLPEEGLVLNSDQVKVLVKEFFQRLFDLEIIRGASGRAWLSTLEVMNKMSGIENGEYKKVKMVSDIIDNIDNVHNFYTKMDEEEANRLYENIKNGKNSLSSSKKAKKEAKEKAKIDKKSKVEDEVI